MTIRALTAIAAVTGLLAFGCGDDSAGTGGSGGTAGSGGHAGTGGSGGSIDAPMIDAPMIDAAMPDAEPDAEPDGAEITCTPPMANCDGNPANGCETNTAADPRNCTACGMVCPGLNTTSANVTCNSGCTFSCQGEHYDVDNDPANGCEVVDNPMNNHTIATSLSEGSRTCTDTDTFTFTGMIPSDSRIHMSPSVSGFDQVSGSAPDFFTIAATGGFTCIDDLSVTLTVTGSASPACYNLTVSTNLITAACQTSTGGTCTITHGSGAYTDGANIGFEVRKTCSVGAVRENASYTVTGHL